MLKVRTGFAPEEIWYCYGEFQPIFGRYPEVKFHEGMPDFTKFDGRFGRSHERNERRLSKSVPRRAPSQKRQRGVSDAKLILQKQAYAYHQSEWYAYACFCSKIHEMQVSFPFWLGSPADSNLSKKRIETPRRDHLAICSWTLNLTRMNGTDLERVRQKVINVCARRTCAHSDERHDNERIGVVYT